LRQDREGHSNGHAARSAETRAALIQVAIELFGSGSFDAVSTRQLAEKAGVALAAITYHFGGKGELFNAAVDAITDYCLVLTKGVAERLSTNVSVDPVGRLERAASEYFWALFGGDEPQSWVNFLVRCSEDAPDAYDKLYAAAFGPLESALTSNLAAHLSVSPKDPGVRLRACVVTNTIVSMRTNRASFLRQLGWKHLGSGELKQLDAMVRALARSDFMLGNSVARVPSRLDVVKRS
jgi:TetR/AcrR family transcriptional regulator, regulator of cefoperazone and chloramphenicol sensitivity